MAGRGPRPRVPSPMGKGDREAVDEVIPSGGPERPENSPAGWFQRRAGGSPGRSARKTARWGRNARKMCQWHIFSEGRAAAPGSVQRRAGGSPGWGAAVRRWMRSVPSPLGFV